jgi:hypothetical protein
MQPAPQSAGYFFARIIINKLTNSRLTKLGTVIAYIPAKTEQERTKCFILKLLKAFRFKI